MYWDALKSPKTPPIKYDSLVVSGGGGGAKTKYNPLELHLQQCPRRFNPLELSLSVSPPLPFEPLDLRHSQDFPPVDPTPWTIVVVVKNKASINSVTKLKETVAKGCDQVHRLPMNTTTKCCNEEWFMFDRKQSPLKHFHPYESKEFAFKASPFTETQFMSYLNSAVDLSSYRELFVRNKEEEEKVPSEEGIAQMIHLQNSATSGVNLLFAKLKRLVVRMSQGAVKLIKFLVSKQIVISSSSDVASAVLIIENFSQLAIGVLCALDTVGTLGKLAYTLWQLYWLRRDLRQMKTAIDSLNWILDTYQTWEQLQCIEFSRFLSKFLGSYVQLLEKNTKALFKQSAVTAMNLQASDCTPTRLLALGSAAIIAGTQWPPSLVFSAVSLLAEVINSICVSEGVRKYRKMQKIQLAFHFSDSISGYLSDLSSNEDWDERAEVVAQLIKELKRLKELADSEVFKDRKLHEILKSWIMTLRVKKKKTEEK